MNVQFNPAFTSNNMATKKQVPQNFGKKIISDKAAEKVGDIGIYFDSAMQRALMGVLALFTQPFIDLKNKNVDEETRKASAARTTAKIIAGTTTGVLIREGCIQATKLFSQNDNIAKYEFEHNKKNIGKTFTPKGEVKKWQQILLPGDKAYKNKIDAASIKKMRNSVGTIAAIVIMLYTNFAIDAPLTTFLTNKLYKPDQKGGK